MQHYQQGAAEVFSFDDRLVEEEVASERESIVALTKERLSNVIFDMRRVRVIDSFGLELICDSQLNCQKSGGRLHIAGTSPLLLDVFRVTGIDRNMRLFNDVMSAAGGFAR